MADQKDVKTEGQKLTVKESKSLGNRIAEAKAKHPRITKVLGISGKIVVGALACLGLAGVVGAVRSGMNGGEDEIPTGDDSDFGDGIE